MRCVANVEVLLNVADRAVNSGTVHVDENVVVVVVVVGVDVG